MEIRRREGFDIEMGRRLRREREKRRRQWVT